MTKNEILKILESAKDKNGDVPMRLVRQAFEKLPIECEDAVSRKDAIIQLSHNKNGDPDCDVIIQHDIETLKRMPPVTPKRKTGKWIEDMKRFGDDAYHCDQCGAILEEDALNWRNNYFCYHCGADMRGKQDE